MRYDDKKWCKKIKIMKKCETEFRHDRIFLVKLEWRRGEMSKIPKSWKKRSFFPIKTLVGDLAPIRMMHKNTKKTLK